MVTGNLSRDSPLVVNLPPKTVAVSITNMSDSSNYLIVGWDEDPSVKSYFGPGDSRGYGPYADKEDYIDAKAVRCAFQNIGSATLNPGRNAALVVVQYISNEDFC